MVAFAPTETFAKPIHAVLSNSPLSNYWLRNGEKAATRRKIVPA